MAHDLVTFLGKTPTNLFIPDRAPMLDQRNDGIQVWLNEFTGVTSRSLSISMAAELQDKSLSLEDSSRKLLVGDSLPTRYVGSL